ncbi:interleukin-1 receptor-like 1 isoform X2 [Denticeps clupeoides]|uniref:interleukin-1 receptor-like 1 isoform X2 n=1 Tax=Denticeps clupeoides TaxID=299321 RepID=UPI0010A5317B|nr:interleukin-1 receptor-like 1 isoform X2 [Denticeps clupeoides]
MKSLTSHSKIFITTEILLLIPVCLPLDIYTNTYERSLVCRNEDEWSALEGEGFCIVPAFELDMSAKSLCVWTHNNTEIAQSVRAQVHQNGSMLCFLPISPNDSGIYTYICAGECALGADVKAYEAHFLGSEMLMFSEIRMHSQNPPIPCPEQAYLMCEEGNGQLTWFKNFQLIPGQNGKVLRLINAQKSDEGLYTCLCTWKHFGQTFNISASRNFMVEEVSVLHSPVIRLPINRSTVPAQLGSSVQLECRVFCGINVMSQCSIFWERNNSRINKSNGYTERTTRNDKGSESVFSTVLYISSVTQQDLHTHFRCMAMNGMEWNSVTIYLKVEECFFFTLILRCAYVLLVCLLVTMAAKYFAIDLALFLRGTQQEEDGKLYDAYVIYQPDSVHDETVSGFLFSTLPTVLEKQCGFKLFIHSRDSLPGEDLAKQVEEHIHLSRRLMIILTSSPYRVQKTTTQPTVGYDWHMVLHSVLVQGAVGMVLVQVGRMRDYAHLPLGVQYLLKQTELLRWEPRERSASSPHSRFWKRVRYMMPPPPPRPITTCI